MGFDPVSAISDLVTTVVGKIFPDANKKLDVQEAKDAAKAAIVEMGQKGELDQVLGQLNINLEEAKSQNVFIAGWRPFIGWVCGAAFGWQYVIGPMVSWVATLMGHPVIIPKMDLAEMMPIMGGMLGLGSLRTFEKYTDTSKNRDAK
jgi:hypothetical protein